MPPMIASASGASTAAMTSTGSSSAGLHDAPKRGSAAILSTGAGAVKQTVQRLGSITPSYFRTP